MIFRYRENSYIILHATSYITLKYFISVDYILCTYKTLLSIFPHARLNRQHLAFDTEKETICQLKRLTGFCDCSEIHVTESKRLFLL